MRAAQMLVEFYEPEDDKLSQAKLSDTRRPRLTLKHLGRLRKTREMQKIEKAEHDEFVTQMYDDSGSEEGAEF